ncbi:hypothetical protein CH333_01765 [candidate division WOR-3 bacterium JGI_Cruoil_03_44_89]|uniref:CHAT domain-containing protein n=1 Tax=candidate division WOR-3 bacterium JGI_Cruoil_03_44_89 TaxID=1973748 RepID=A0A235BYA0_UNCW3|nr:MAG: hypothetical protein CH333_01765 [candidate division WOR-3 bacterium JGI_Cruoil_03_44_89]
MGPKTKKQLLDEFTPIELSEIAAEYDIAYKRRKKIIESLSKEMKAQEIRQRLDFHYKRDKKILLIEGIPKKEGYDETGMIEKLAKMANFEAKRYQPSRKAEAIDLIRSLDYGLIHISSHGTKGALNFGRIKIMPGDLSTVDRIYSQILTIGACEVGDKEFMRKIAFSTGIPIIIAPSKLIYFLDSAVFFVIFYHFFFKGLIKKKKDAYIYGSDIHRRAHSSFEKAKKAIRGFGLTGKIKLFDFTMELSNAFKY